MQQTTFVKLSAIGFGLVLVSFLIRGFSGLVVPVRGPPRCSRHRRCSPAAGLSFSDASVGTGRLRDRSVGMRLRGRLVRIAV